MSGTYAPAIMALSEYHCGVLHMVVCSTCMLAVHALQVLQCSILQCFRCIRNIDPIVAALN